jgi:hypothetical protein
MQAPAILKLKPAASAPGQWSRFRRSSPFSSKRRHLQGAAPLRRSDSAPPSLPPLYATHVAPRYHVLHSLPFGATTDASMRADIIVGGGGGGSFAQCTFPSMRPTHRKEVRDRRCPAALVGYYDVWDTVVCGMPARGCACRVRKTAQTSKAAKPAPTAPLRPAGASHLLCALRGLADARCRGSWET